MGFISRQTMLERELQLEKEDCKRLLKKRYRNYTNKWVNGNYALKRRELEASYGIKAWASLGIGEIKVDPSLDIMELQTWKDNETSSSPEFVPLT